MTLAFAIQFAPGVPLWVGVCVASIAVIILGISKSGFGGGVGIVAVPLFAIAFGAQRGSAILLPLLIAADIFSVWHHWGTWDKKILKVLVPGTLFGILVGSVALAWLVRSGDGKARQNSAGMLNFVTGIVSVLYVSLELLRARFAPKWHFKPNQGTGFLAGSAVGVISTLAHAAGPVAAIFLLNQGLPRAVFMGTTVIYFFGINTTKLIPYSVIPGLINGDSVMTGACFVLLVPVGTWLGKWMFDRMSEIFFRRLILTITFLTGAQLIVEYATGVSLAQAVAGLGR